MKTSILNQINHLIRTKGSKILTLAALCLIAITFVHAQTTVTFNYTGAMQTWVVPPCVFNINVDVRGAKGGNSNFGTGGNGAKVTATIAVTPGQTLNIYVGGSGGNPTGGWNGGGNGIAGFSPGGNSRGGGGASDIRIGGTALANRVIVAGGGGGGAGGTPTVGSGGAGGCATGVTGTGSPFTGTGGGGGSQVAGGVGGPPWGGGGFPGTAGSLGQGGTGGTWPSLDASGGGGGGGYYGGGGGGSDGCCSGANGGGGGGGGSSFTPAGGICTQGFNAGNGVITITYTPGAPAPSASNTGPYCAGATINLSSLPAGATTYAWAGPNSYSTPNTQNPTIPSSTVAMGGIYTVTVTAVGGCTATATTTVVVNPQPVPTATNTGPYCAGNTIQLNSPTGFPTDDWTGPAGYVQNDMQNPTIAASTPAMTGDYTVTVTDPLGCSATATTTVTVNALPVPNAANTGPYCENDPVNLSSNGGIDYDWTGPGGFTLANTQNPGFPTAAMPMNGTYTVTVTDANNCSATATTTVVVNLLPIPVANNDGPFCEGDPIHLTSGGGSNYGWNGPGGYVSAIQNPTINSSVVANTGTYTVLVTTAQGCTGTTTTDVVVTALPTPQANNTGPYCEGDRIDLSVIGGISWVWAGPLAFGSTLQNPSINSAIPTNSGNYTVTATDGAGCVSQTTTVVLVSPTPTAVAQFSPQNPSMLKPDVDFTGDGSYANIAAYLWDIDGTPYNSSTFTHTFTDPGDFPSYLVVTNIYGCIDTLSFNVHVDPATSIYIPNSFTPNGDDLNEIFYVYGLGWERIEMIIFDRWGQEIFYSTDPSKGWNGTKQNAGEVLQEGTYTYKVYIIDIYGKEHNFMGHINMIR